MLTSQRIEPCSIRTSETPRPRITFRSSVTYALATSGASAPRPGTGFVTISTSGMPARLKSTSEWVAPWIRPVEPPTCSDLPVSSSMCTRSMPIRYSLPSTTMSR